MKPTHSLFAAALLLALTSPLTTTMAQTPITAAARGGHYGAPGPVLGAGLPTLAAGGIGYGIYWLVKRRRRKADV